MTTERSGTGRDWSGPTAHDLDLLSSRLEHGLRQIDRRVDWLERTVRRTEQRVDELVLARWTLYACVLIPLAVWIVAISVIVGFGPDNSG